MTGSTLETVRKELLKLLERQSKDDNNRLRAAELLIKMEKDRNIYEKLETIKGVDAATVSTILAIVMSIDPDKVQEIVSFLKEKVESPPKQLGTTVSIDAFIYRTKSIIDSFEIIGGPVNKATP